MQTKTKHDMKHTPLFIRDKNFYGLTRVTPTLQELRLAKGYHYMLETLVKTAVKGRGWVSETQSKLFGRVTYRAQYRGKCWWHTVTFDDEPQAFYYEEMRHGLQMAIFGVCGESTQLQMSFDKKSASFRLAHGRRLEVEGA